MESLVINEVKGRTLYLTLNRPEKRNALSPALVTALKTSLEAAQENESIRTVVIRGSSSAFCAGADLDYIKSMSDYSFEDNLFDSTSLAKLFEMIYHFPKPVITQVDGPALAGGCGLATIGDFCFASDRSSFGYTEVKIGFIPAIVSVFLCRKIGEGKARDLMLTGRIVKAEEALQLGLINRVYAAEALEQAVLEFAEKLGNETSPQAIASTKNLIAEVQNRDLESAIGYAAEMNANARASQDCKAGISAFLRKEKWSW